jgi:hypothetical protein
MATAVSMALPFLSTLVVVRCAPLARLVASRTGLTLPLGWAAVMVVLASALGLAKVPVAALIACSLLAGLSMVTPVPGDDDDWPGGDPDDPEPGPVIDWDEFDRTRRRWTPQPRAGSPSPRVPVTH